jgi:hypothetical protein
MTETAIGGARWRRCAPWIGGALCLAALAWVLRGIDLDHLLAALVSADPRMLALVPVAIAGEQLVHAWKWRQLLCRLRPIGTPSLFGAIMAGYFAGRLFPIGVSPLVRSWLVARREGLRTSSVLATVTIDRLVDGIVFVGFVPVALVLVAVPDLTSGLRAALYWGAGGSLVLFVLLLLALAVYRNQAIGGARWFVWCIDRLPRRLAEPTHRLARSFAEGILWPRETARRLGVVLASVVMNLIAGTQLLWAGLALGVLLKPEEYLFLMVCVGFVAYFARMLAGFTIGAVFTLGLLGVPEEQALVMALIVQSSDLLTFAGIGVLVLWRHGVTLTELRTAGAPCGLGQRAAPGHRGCRHLF